MNMHAGYASCQFARHWIPVRVGFAEGQTIRVAHRPDGQAFLRITRNDGQAVVAPGLPSCAGVEQEAALLLGILFSAITPLGQRIFAYNVALLTSKAFQLL
jgi:hypothetical protein